MVNLFHTTYFRLDRKRTKQRHIQTKVKVYRKQKEQNERKRKKASIDSSSGSLVVSTLTLIN